MKLKTSLWKHLTQVEAEDLQSLLIDIVEPHVELIETLKGTADEECFQEILLSNPGLCTKLIMLLLFFEEFDLARRIQYFLLPKTYYHEFTSQDRTAAYFNEWKAIAEETKERDIFCLVNKLRLDDYHYQKCLWLLHETESILEPEAYDFVFENEGTMPYLVKHGEEPRDAEWIYALKYSPHFGHKAPLYK